MPKISVIIPIFNCQDYLECCLKSIVNQTLKDIEIICINDCTKDSSWEIVKSFANTDSRFKLIENKTNRKQGYCRNLGIKMATAPYIHFIDSDDFLVDTSCYEKIYNQMLQEDLEIFNFSYLTYDNKSGHIKQERVWNNLNSFYKKKKYILNISPFPWDKIYKKSFLIQHSIYYPEDIYFEDMTFANIISVQCKKIKFCTEVYYAYRQNTGISICSDWNSKIDSVLPAHEAILQYLKTHNLYKRYKIKYLECCINSFSFFMEQFNSANKQKFATISDNYIKTSIKINLFDFLHLIFKNKFFFKNIMRIYFGCSCEKSNKHKIIQIGKLKIKIKNKKLELLETINTIQRKSEKDYNNLYTVFKTCINIRNIPKATGTLRKIQLLDLSLMKELQKICKQLNIKFWLRGGTALGAFRHSGFIPWDDDVDLGMLRCDFEKLEKHVNNNCNNFEITYYYHQNCKVAKFKYKNSNAPIFLDIFPFDYCEYNNPDVFWFKWMRDKESLITKLEKIKFQDGFANTLTKEQMEQIESINEQYKHKYINSPHQSGICSAIEQLYPSSKRIFKADEIFPLSITKFENNEFYVPRNLQNYLELYYGPNYMEMPNKIEFFQHEFMYNSECYREIEKYTKKLCIGERD